MGEPRTRGTEVPYAVESVARARPAGTRALQVEDLSQATRVTPSSPTPRLDSKTIVRTASSPEGPAHIKPHGAPY